MLGYTHSRHRKSVLGHDRSAERGYLDPCGKMAAREVNKIFDFIVSDDLSICQPNLVVMSVTRNASNCPTAGLDRSYAWFRCHFELEGMASIGSETEPT